MASAPIRCDTCAVRHRAVCGALTQKEIERLNSIAHHKTFGPGDFLFGEQEQLNYFANVISGVVKLTKSLSDGRQQVVGLQFASDFLGRPYRPTCPYTAEAVTPIHLCAYEKGQFERLVTEMPGLEHRLFENTLDELDAAHEWMLLLGRKSALEKVASFLYLVAQRIDSVGCRGRAPGAPLQFDLPLTRAEIADFLGLTIETVSRQFSKLKLGKLIGLDGSRTVIVLDAQGLQSVASSTD